MTPAVFSHGDLRLYLLSLLAEEPRHGYDLIQALADRTGGTYTPSAGTIYPRLAKLEEEGLVTKTIDGRKTVYAITDAGRAELASREDDLSGIEQDLADSVRLIADSVRQGVSNAMKTLRTELAAAAEEVRASGSRSERTKPSEPTPAAEPRAASDGPSPTTSREQVQRADAAINAFRARMRTTLRTHVARGGGLAASVIDELERGLNEVADAAERALR